MKFLYNVQLLQYFAHEDIFNPQSYCSLYPIAIGPWTEGYTGTGGQHKTERWVNMLRNLQVRVFYYLNILPTAWEIEIIGKTCAIALAFKDIFPEVFVSGYYIHPFGSDDDNPMASLEIPLPKIAQDFVRVFDSLSAIPGVQPMLPEFEFEILMPDEVIEGINIDEVRNLEFQRAIWL